MDAREWLARNERLLESPWERLFVEAVLARLSGLDFAHVTAQRPFKDFEGNSRRSDFTIEQGSEVRIAIEVMGFWAAPEAMRDFVADSKKTISLGMDGWQVLHVANSVFGKSDGGVGPPKPRERGADACARWIGLEIERQKKVAMAAQQSAALRERLRLVERRLDDAQQAKDDARARWQRAEQRAEDVGNELRKARDAGNPERERLLRQQLDEAKAQLSERDMELKSRSAELEQAMAQAAENPTVSLTRTQWEVYERLRDEMAQAMEALRADMARSAQGERQETEPRIAWVAESSPSRWKWITGGVAGGLAVVAVAGGAAWLAAGAGGRADHPTPPRPSAVASPTQAAQNCESTTDWAFMVNCGGKEVTAKGPVAGSSYQASVTGKPTFVNIGNDFPDARRLEIVIWGNCRTNFPAALETAYRGKTIYVTGKVEVREGVAQIAVCSPNQIKVES